MRIRSVWILFVVLTLPSAVSAQRRAPGSAPPSPGTNATIALKAGGTAYDFTGPAACEHAPRGSIYDVLAERWSVRHGEGARNLNLTLWHPLSTGPDMLTLSVSVGGKRYNVNTVKGPSSETSGTGTVRFAAAGNGGTFTIDATTASGAKITGSIKCDAFTSAEVAGG